MKNYDSLISSSFWTEGMGDEKQTPDGQARLLLLYMMVSRQGNGSNLYDLPLSTIEEDTALSRTQIIKALQTLSDLGLCTYCQETQQIWLPKMDRYHKGYVSHENPDQAIALVLINTPEEAARIGKVLPLNNKEVK